MVSVVALALNCTLRPVRRMRGLRRSAFGGLAAWRLGKLFCSAMRATFSSATDFAAFGFVAKTGGSLVVSAKGLMRSLMRHPHRPMLCHLLSYRPPPPQAARTLPERIQNIHFRLVEIGNLFRVETVKRLPEGKHRLESVALIKLGV